MSQQNTLRGIICEAYGCLGAAEQKINIPVGQIGKMEVSVCSNCRPKFNDVDGYEGKLHYKDHSQKLEAVTHSISKSKECCK